MYVENALVMGYNPITSKHVSLQKYCCHHGTTPSWTIATPCSAYLWHLSTVTHPAGAEFMQYVSKPSTIWQSTPPMLTKYPYDRD